jgi:GNAT superfamily N-acetyltransferase
MEQTVGEVRLKSGETMSVLHVAAPCGDWGERLLSFMYLRHLEYTNGPWHRNCQRVVVGEFAGVSRDVFFLGLIEGELAGTSWYATPLDTGDLATFGRVVTGGEHRRKGIASALCRVAVDDFRAAGGWCMHLGTSRQNPAHAIYESLGFRDYNFMETNGTVMRAVLQGGTDSFESDYFAAGQPVSLRPLHWGDLARAELLLNLPHWFLKDYTLGLYANTPFEGQFFDLMGRVADHGETGTALATNDGRMVGLCYTARTNAGADAQDHVRVLEFAVHPSYAESGPQLVAAVALDCPAWKLLAYASALDVQKCEALEEAGFVQEATLEGALQDAESEFDLYIYSMSR